MLVFGIKHFVFNNSKHSRRFTSTGLNAPAYRIIQLSSPKQVCINSIFQILTMILSDP